MTAQPVDVGLEHGTLQGYGWHYRWKIPVCGECRAAATDYQRQQRRTRRLALAPRISVVPYGWPCKACVWTERLPTSDGRIISWRVQRCPRHRVAW